MLQIYEMLHSPYCIPITMMLKASGKEYESITVLNWDRSKVIELTGGAYYQVPVLVDGDEVVSESDDSSLNVAQYVNEKFVSNEMFPTRISGIHEVMVSYIEDELEGFGFKLCDIHYLPAIEDLSQRTAVIRHKERRFGRGCVDAWRAKADSLQAEFTSALNRFEGTLTENRFLFGEEPVYADYALAGVIGNFTYPEANELDADQSWLRDWLHRLSEFRC
ncbi:MAG: glutathione S-transferase family protein [Limisphaerales bacterium]